jgi:serine protease Do
MLIDMRIELPANGYGGPLINADGVVIGITTENIHADPTRRTDPREAHALPIGVAMIFYRATESYPTSQQNWIGIDLRPLRPADKDRIYKLLGTRAGLLADFVWIDGPAGHTDIRPGDVIFQINGRSINDTHDLTAFLRSASPGKPAELAILRDGKGILRRVRITARPPWAGFVR